MRLQWLHAAVGKGSNPATRYRHRSSDPHRQRAVIHGQRQPTTTGTCAAEVDACDAADPASLAAAAATHRRRQAGFSGAAAPPCQAAEAAAAAAAVVGCDDTCHQASDRQTV
jgi:hypothetical protein